MEPSRKNPVVSRGFADWNNWQGVKAPTLDPAQIFAQARNTGRNEAMAEFYDTLMKHEKERAKASQASKAEEDAAAKDLGNEPESEGFWKKLGQGALDGAMWTLDKLSRPLYGVANTVDYLREQNEDAPNIVDRTTPLGFNLVNSVDDLNVGDIGGSAKAFWKGISGQEKTFFMDIAAKQAEHDTQKNIFDNPWYQVGAGLTADIAADPLTYVGVGIVTKPRQIAKAAEHIAEVNAKAAGIAEDIAKLPSRVGGAGEHAAQTADDVMLSKEQVYNILTGEHIKPSAVGKRSNKAGVRLSRTKDKTKRVRHYIDNIEQLKKDIRKNPLRDDSEIKKIEAQIDELRNTHVKALEDYTMDVFREAGKRFENNPKLWPDPVQLPAQYVEDGLELAKASRAFGTIGFRKYLLGKHVGQIGLGAAGAEDAAKTAKKIEELGGTWDEAAKSWKFKDDFHDMLGDAWKTDERIADLRNNVYDIVEGIAKKNPVYRQEMTKLYGGWNVDKYDHISTAEAGIASQLRSAYRELTAARRAGRVDDVGRLEQSVNALQEVQAASWRKINDLHADILFKLTGHKLDQLDSFSPSEMQAITEKRAQLNELYDRAAQLGDNSPSVGVFDEGAKEAGSHAKDKFYRPLPGTRKSHTLDEEVPLDAKNGAKPPSTKSNINNEGLAVQREIDKVEREIAQILENPTGHTDPVHIPDEFAVDRSTGNSPKATSPVGTVAQGLVLKSGELSPLARHLFKNENLEIAEGLSKEGKAFARELRDQILARKATKNAAKIKSWRRAERAKHKAEITPKKIKDMFGMKRKSPLRDEQVVDSIPQIRPRSDGPVIKMGDKEALKPFVTEADRKAAGFINGASTLGIDDVIKHFDAELHAQGGTRKAILKVVHDSHAIDPATIFHRLSTMPRLYDEELDAAFDWVMKVKRFATDNGIGAARTTVTHVSPEHVAFQRLFQAEHGVSIRSAQKARKTFKEIDLKAPTQKRSYALPPKIKQQFAREAQMEAMREVGSELADGSLKTVNRNKVLKLQRKTPDEEINKVKDAYEAAKRKAKLEYQQAASHAARTKPRGSTTAADTAQKIDELKATLKAKTDALDEMYDEAVKTKQAMADRLDEQFLIDMLADVDNMGQKRLQFNFAGRALPISIASPKVLTAATEKLGGLHILQKTQEAWAEAFHPASKLTPDLNVARLRAQGRVNDILKHHLDEVFKAFNKFKPEEQRAALRAIKTGAPVGNPELYATANRFLDGLTYYTGGHASVGGEVLSLSELNKYLADEFKFLEADGSSVFKTELNSGQEIVEAMRRLKPDTDIMKVIWNLRIAAEKAMAEKAMKYTIAKTFGIKRVLAHEDDFTEGMLERRDLIEALRDKHGWNTVDGFHEKYYFAPDAAKEIEKLLDMMRPERTQEVVRLYDRALRVWKSTVTVYNPGYYTRNAIGEVMMGLFDGVANPKWYHKAGSVLRYSMPDEVMETLKEIQPWKRHATQRQLGARPLVTMKSGEKLNAEDIWVLYHEHNLKSGFISTEYDHYFPAARDMRANPVGQMASKINDKARQEGEKFEDFFRLAHFMDRLSRSNHRSIQAAAQEAADAVRKYHFDYTDFTQFEKTKMMRIFPFYKWTRKAIPLMAGMLFTEPGKVTLYPKAMSGLSIGSGATDPLADTNGFMPNYDEVVPQWMRGMLAYPVGSDESGAMDYMNVATPAMDVYKMLQNPGSAMLGMLTPFAKVPLEQIGGDTIDPAFDQKLDSGSARFDNLAKTTPIGSLLDNIYRNRGEGDSAISEPGMSPLDERLTSFISGLGFYENNEKRKKGEQFRQAIEGSK